MAQSYTTNPFVVSDIVSTDLTEANANFEALKSSFSGATAPSNTVAGIWWFDTTSNILKIRNEANSAWQSVWDFANAKPAITNLSDEITLAMMNSATKSPSAATEGLRKIGTGALDACAGNDSRLVTLTAVAGDELIGREDTEVTINNGNYKYIKTFQIPIAGTYRFRCKLKTSSPSFPAKIRMYRYSSTYDGEGSEVSIGVEQSVTATSWTTKTQDISGWSVADYCHLYMTSSYTVATATLKNWRMCCADAQIAAM